MSVEEIKDEIVKKDKSKFLTFLAFLLISSLLWFLIKLSKEYTTQTDFTVVYTDAPVNKWVSTNDQHVKLSFVADGFITLRHNLVRVPNRVVEISLEEVSYRHENGNTYSYGSQYVAERVADWLGVPSGNVTVNDDKQYFSMSKYGALTPCPTLRGLISTRASSHTAASISPCKTLVPPSTMTLVTPRR